MAPWWLLRTVSRLAAATAARPEKVTILVTGREGMDGAWCLVEGLYAFYTWLSHGDVGLARGVTAKMD